MKEEDRKTYVVYNKKHDLIGIHRGPKFIDLQNPEVVYFWPHDIDHGGVSFVLNDKTFLKEYYFLGEL